MFLFSMRNNVELASGHGYISWHLILKQLMFACKYLWSDFNDSFLSYQNVKFILSCHEISSYKLRESQCLYKHSVCIPASKLESLSVTEWDSA